MKKSILFAYPEMMLGGSTTSLITLLNTIDYSKYEIDLILYRNQGDFIKDLPKEVNLLNQASKYEKKSFPSKLKFLSLYLRKGYIFKAIFGDLRYKKRIGLNMQVLSKIAASISRTLDKEYDVAIGYLEYWANDYVLDYVKSKKKIAWIHTDYISAKLVPALDFGSFSKAANIVCVSQECGESCKKAFPLLEDKVMIFENIISSDTLKQKANERMKEADFDIDTDFIGLKVITVSRLDMYAKGIDRIIHATKKLCEDGYPFKWYLIGDGQDYNKIKKMIYKNHLENNLILLGRKNNPYPYLKKCDVYAMPSRYEGKPMAVTEAQILGIPILVTNYSSAFDQVRNGVDGTVVENNDVSIYYGVKEILESPKLLDTYRNNLKDRNLSNEYTIESFYELLHQGESVFDC